MTAPALSADLPASSRALAAFDRLAASGWQAYAAVAAVHLVLALLAYDPSPQTGGDNGAYRALAEALLSGAGYVRLWEPGHARETLYPPVFPMVLAGAMALGARSFAALQLVMVGVSTAAVTAMFLWLRRVLSARAALACGVLIALSPGVITASHALLSDVMFAGLSALALALFARLDDGRPRSAQRRTAIMAVAVTATVLSYFTRSAGLPLLLAALGWLAWRRHIAGAIVLLLVTMPLAVMWGGRGKGPEGSAYTDFLRYVDPYRPELGRVDGLGLLSRMLANFWSYATTHLPVLLFGTRTGFAGLGGLIVLSLAAVGYVARARRPSAAEIWLPLYAGVLLLWPQVWSGERLLLPLYPLLLAYTVVGYLVVRDRLSTPFVWFTLAFSALTIILSDGERIARGVRCTASYRNGTADPCIPGEWGDYFAVARSLRGKLPEGTAILSRKPTILYALSGYPSTVYPLSAEPDTLFAAARRVGANYILVDLSQLTELYVYPALRAVPHRFCTFPEFTRNASLLVRIEPEATPVAAAADSTIPSCR